MPAHSHSQRFTATVNTGVVHARTTKDQTFAVSLAVTTDRVLLNPVDSVQGEILMGESFVSGQGVITVRFGNPTTTDVEAGSDISLVGTLFKGTGKI